MLASPVGGPGGRAGDREPSAPPARGKTAAGRCCRTSGSSWPTRFRAAPTATPQLGGMGAFPGPRRWGVPPRLRSCNRDDSIGETDHYGAQSRQVRGNPGGVWTTPQNRISPGGSRIHIAAPRGTRRTSKRTWLSSPMACTGRWRRIVWRSSAWLRLTRIAPARSNRGRCSGTARAVRRWWWCRRAVFAWAASPVYAASIPAWPVHEVSVPSFALSKYEVTFEEYDRFARDTDRRRPDDHGWGRRGAVWAVRCRTGRR